MRLEVIAIGHPTEPGAAEPPAPKITGVDGKTYPSTPTQPRRRKSLLDTAHAAGRFALHSTGQTGPRESDAITDFKEPRAAIRVRKLRNLMSRY